MFLWIKRRSPSLKESKKHSSQSISLSNSTGSNLNEQHQSRSSHYHHHHSHHNDHRTHSKHASSSMSQRKSTETTTHLPKIKVISFLNNWLRKLISNYALETLKHALNRKFLSLSLFIFMFIKRNNSCGNWRDTTPLNNNRRQIKEPAN